MVSEKINKIKIEKEFERWFISAERDLKKARDNFNIGHYDLTSFLCQQAVEKALKSLLIKQTNKFPKIHDLVRLGNLVNVDKDLLENCKKLTTVYTENRYPDVSVEEYTKEESEDDIEITEKILKWVKKKLL